MRRIRSTGTGRRVLATAATVAVVTATAGFTVLAGSSGSTAAGPRSSAYAFAATGLVPFEGQPYVESSDGTTQTANFAELPENPLASLTAGSVSAGNNKASVEMLNVAVGGGIFEQLPPLPPEVTEACNNLPADPAPIPDLPDLPELPIPGAPDLDDLPADNLQDLCKLLLTPPDSLLGLDMLKVSCNGGTGKIEMGGLTLLGQEIEIPAGGIPAPPDNPLLKITVGEKTNNPDGSFTITGLKVSLGPEREQSIILGSATCAKYKAPSPTPTDTPTAPSPTPVPTKLPVTG